MKELQFIESYCTVCQHYDTTLVLEAQRQSNNFRPKFTDEECIATYLFGIRNQKFTVSGCYSFIKDYYGDWFPDLPSYQAYNHRICYLADALLPSSRNQPVMANKNQPFNDGYRKFVYDEQRANLHRLS